MFPYSEDGHMDALNPLRVLVVEDNADAAETLALPARRIAASTSMSRHNTQDGLKTARRLEPHIVLCDIGLPDGDGYSVGSQLRQSSCTQGASSR